MLQLMLLALTSCLPFSALAVDVEKPKITQLLKTTTSWDGKQIVYPVGQPEITGLMVEIAPGQQTNWHSHPSPSFAVIMEGTLEIILKDGRVKRLQTGDPLVEVINTPHNGRNIGTAPLKIMVFYAGIVGRKLTIEEPD